MKNLNNRTTNFDKIHCLKLYDFLFYVGIDCVYLLLDFNGFTQGGYSTKITGRIGQRFNFLIIILMKIVFLQLDIFHQVYHDFPVFQLVNFYLYRRKFQLTILVYSSPIRFQ